jgi:hypothetical protein
MTEATRKYCGLLAISWLLKLCGLGENAIHENHEVQLNLYWIV